MTTKLRNLSTRLKTWVCSKIGHSFSPVSQVIFRIKTNELNQDMNATITCRVCGGVFVHKDSPLAEGKK